MRRALIIVIAVAIGVAIGLGGWWFLNNKATAPSAPASMPDTTSTHQSVPDTTSNTATGDVRTGTVTIDMKDTAFSPASIKVKKGTKVVWTNQDSVRHNVVADANNSNNLPTANNLLGKGESYSFTFTTVGTVTYHCTPHPFMTGAIEVVE